MALPKNYHSMKPSDKIEAQQAEYGQLNKIYTVGSEKPVYFPGKSQKFLWREAVSTRKHLPLRPAALEARFVLDEDAAYFWFAGRWQRMITEQALAVTPKEPRRSEKYDMLKGLLDHKLRPDKMIMSEDTFNALVEWFEHEKIQDELMPSMEEEGPDWLMDAFEAKDVDL